MNNNGVVKFHKTFNPGELKTFGFMILAYFINSSSSNSQLIGNTVVTSLQLPAQDQIF